MDTGCLGCQRQKETVVAIDRRGVPHSQAGHKTVYDFSLIAACQECSRGILARFSHDCWAQPWDEPWDMSWQHSIDPTSMARLREGLANCPVPLDDGCGCPAHQLLRATSERCGRARAVGVTLTEQDLPQLAPLGQ